MRARASKKSILAFIAITLSVKMMNLQNPHFYSPHHQKLSPQNLPLQPTCRFLPTNVSFSPKQRVVFSQTTCRFLSNNVSFSLKQRVVFFQTRCWFLPNNVSFLYLRVVIKDKIPFCNFLVKKFRRGFYERQQCSSKN